MTTTVAVKYLVALMKTTGCTGGGGEGEGAGHVEVEEAEWEQQQVFTGASVLSLSLLSPPCEDPFHPYASFSHPQNNFFNYSIKEAKV